MKFRAIILTLGVETRVGKGWSNAAQQCIWSIRQTPALQGHLSVIMRGWREGEVLVRLYNALETSPLVAR